MSGGWGDPHTGYGGAQHQHQQQQGWGVGLGDKGNPPGYTHHHGKDGKEGRGEGGWSQFAVDETGTGAGAGKGATWGKGKGNKGQAPPYTQQHAKGGKGGKDCWSFSQFAINEPGTGVGMQAPWKGGKPPGSTTGASGFYEGNVSYGKGSTGKASSGKGGKKGERPGHWDFPHDRPAAAPAHPPIAAAPQMVAQPGLASLEVPAERQEAEDPPDFFPVAKAKPTGGSSDVANLDDVETASAASSLHLPRNPNDLHEAPGLHGNPAGPHPWVVDAGRKGGGGGGPQNYHGGPANPNWIGGKPGQAAPQVEYKGAKGGGGYGGKAGPYNYNQVQPQQHEAVGAQPGGGGKAVAFGFGKNDKGGKGDGKGDKGDKGKGDKGGKGGKGPENPGGFDQPLDYSGMNRSRGFAGRQVHEGRQVAVKTAICWLMQDCPAEASMSFDFLVRHLQNVSTLASLSDNTEMINNAVCDVYLQCMKAHGTEDSPLKRTRCLAVLHTPPMVRHIETSVAKVPGGLSHYLLLLRVCVAASEVGHFRAKREAANVMYTTVMKYRTYYQDILQSVAGMDKADGVDGAWESPAGTPEEECAKEIVALLSAIEVEHRQRVQHDPGAGGRGPAAGKAEITYKDCSLDLFDDVFDEPPFVHDAIVDGPLPSLEWQFNTQFHLLREDFLLPLRKGISSLGKSRVQDIWFDQEVWVTGIGTCFDGVVHSISIPRKTHRRFPRDRLKTGSLICLSDKKFEKGSLLWGIVIGMPDVKEAEVVFNVKFRGLYEMIMQENPRYDSVSGMIGDRFNMIESRVFYEAYSHVLRVIHGKDIATLPFHDILTAKPEALQNIEPPDTLVGKDIVINAMLVDDPVKYPADDPVYWKYDTLDPSKRVEFPAHLKKILDASQFKCAKDALTQKVAIIQGPPGTGKSFVGTRIVRVLLDTLYGLNRDKTSVQEEEDKVIWAMPPARPLPGFDYDDYDDEAEELHPEDTKPILVLCQTNHALDSVLVDLIGSCPDDYESPVRPVHEDRVLRLGGSSRVESIKKRNAMKVLNQLSTERDLRAAKHRRRSLRNDVDRDRKQFDRTLLMQASQGEIPNSFSEFISRRREEYHAIIRQLHEDIEKITDEIPNHPKISERHTELQCSLHEHRQQLAETQSALQNPLDAWLEGVSLKGQAPQHEADAADEDVNVARVGGDADDELPSLPSDGYGKLPPDERWRHFDYWTRHARRNAKQSLYDNCNLYEDACKVATRLENEAMSRLMRTARVIGATTTGCAKFSQVMEHLQPEIIVVEEAAEVLESHILSVLSPRTKHILLIGDHKQLQPKVNVLEMERKGLCVSLMERLVLSGMKPSVLLTQRRMREEICVVTSPFYAPLQIESHASTRNHPQFIKGLQHPLWFVTHNCPESRDDGSSPHNEYEALYAIGLAGHLLRQGYEASQITILVAYKGQFHYLTEKIRNLRNVWNNADKRGAILQGLRRIKVVCVDNFQGEENDIVILSLVRSGGTTHGFLKRENRLIVALSRARWGMYVLANMDHLKTASAEWQRVYSDAQGRRIMGPELKIQCRRHNLTAPIKTYKDFVTVSEYGGCSRICNVRMDCGHPCKRKCHSDNYDHEDRVCEEKCGRVREACIPPRYCEHPCMKRCEDDCGECSVIVMKQLSCGHQQKAPCGRSCDQISCSQPCKKVLPCGHTCRNKCGSRCTACSVPVPKMLPCGHTVDVPCHMPANEMVCPKPCPEKLACDHVCGLTCGKCTKTDDGIPLHECWMECKRVLVCGHVCSSMCSKMCPPCRKPCMMRCDHSECTKSCGEECVRCAMSCTWSCKHHRCAKQCWEVCSRKKCDEPCPKKLRCGHPCRGVCGDPCPEFCAECGIGGELYSNIMLVEPEDNAQYIQLGCKHIFDIPTFDHYVTAEMGKEKVQWLLCPTCRRPILPHETGRYRAEVNRSVISVNAVRERVRDQEKTFKHTRCNLQSKLSDLNILDERGGIALTYLKQRVQQARFEEIVPLQRQVELFEFRTRAQRWVHAYGDHGTELLNICDNAITKVLTEESVKSVALQVRSLSVRGRMFKIENSLVHDGMHIEGLAEFRADVTELGQLTGVMTAETIDDWERRVHEHEKVLDRDRIIADLKMAASALQLGAGHWFRCPNGHLYVIADCGGAVTGSRCPDCDAPIGGEGYGLASGNEFAGGDIDATAEPSWNVPAMQRGI